MARCAPFRQIAAVAHFYRDPQPATAGLNAAYRWINRMSEFNWMRKADRQVYINALLDGFRRGLITPDAACRDLRDIILSSTRIRFALVDERCLMRRIAAIFRNLQMGALAAPQAGHHLEKLLTAAIRNDVGFFTSSHLMADA